jgi:hypothetical protein
MAQGFSYDKTKDREAMFRLVSYENTKRGETVRDVVRVRLMSYDGGDLKISCVSEWTDRDGNLKETSLNRIPLKAFPSVAKGVKEMIDEIKAKGVPETKKGPALPWEDNEAF